VFLPKSSVFFSLIFTFIMSEPVAEQPVVAPVDENVPTTTEQPAAEEAVVPTEEAPKAEEPTATAEATETAAAEAPKSEKRKSKILDLFNKIKVSLVYHYCRQNGL
jgi:hypothetical protein